jgi:hypothetical protein
LTKKEGGCILLTRILIVDNDDEAINLNGWSAQRQVQDSWLVCTHHQLSH